MHRLMVLLEWLTALCALPRQAPNAQSLSNTLLACAILRLQVEGHVSTALVEGLLSLDWSVVDKQAYCNAAWRPTALNCANFLWALASLLLDQLAALSANHHELSQSSMLKFAELTQLYQVLGWLQPHPTAPAQQQSAWSCLQGKLHRLGPRPAPETPPFYGIRKLYAALDQLQLSFTAAVVIQSYLVAAVLQSQDNKA